MEDYSFISSSNFVPSFLPLFHFFERNDLCSFHCPKQRGIAMCVLIGGVTMAFPSQSFLWFLFQLCTQGNGKRSSKKWDACHQDVLSCMLVCFIVVEDVLCSSCFCFFSPFVYTSTVVAAVQSAFWWVLGTIETHRGQKNFCDFSITWLGPLEKAFFSKSFFFPEKALSRHPPGMWRFYHVISLGHSRVYPRWASVFFIASARAVGAFFFFFSFFFASER